MSDDSRVFKSYPIITLFAKDEEEAAQMLYALQDTINAHPGMDTQLDEECYEWTPTSDRSWEPTRPWLRERTSGCWRRGGRGEGGVMWLRRLRLAVAYREWPWNIPANVVALAGMKRPPEHVFEFFRRLHGIDKP